MGLFLPCQQRHQILYFENFVCPRFQRAKRPKYPTNPHAGQCNRTIQPPKKLYVEFTGTNGDETDTSHFQDFNEEDVVWEMVYASDGVPVWSYSLTIPFDTREEESLIPPLLHDDIKKGYYLPTWRERYQHRWKCLWGMTPKAPKEAPDSKKKDEQPIPVLELNEVATTCHLKPSTTRQPCS
ncbi:hypothetical protein TWF569_006255 [Orbilia oligospora]|nr:hypothetical protein TWF569_006255 [Orbilia oligospora]